MTKPSILIYVSKPNKELLKEICAGIEEEGVYCEVIYKENDDINSLSYGSSNESILGTGIGMCGSKMSLSLSALPKGQQIFNIEEPSSSQARNLGANAARAVKRKAFK